jgi:hypothetical protein
MAALGSSVACMRLLKTPTSMVCGVRRRGRVVSQAAGRCGRGRGRPAGEPGRRVWAGARRQRWATGGGPGERSGEGEGGRRLRRANWEILVPVVEVVVFGGVLSVAGRYSRAGPGRPSTPSIQPELDARARRHPQICHALLHWLLPCHGRLCDSDLTPTACPRARPHRSIRCSLPAARRHTRGGRQSGHPPAPPPSCRAEGPSARVSGSSRQLHASPRCECHVRCSLPHGEMQPGHVLTPVPLLPSALTFAFSLPAERHPALHRACISIDVSRPRLWPLFTRQALLHVGLLLYYAAIAFSCEGRHERIRNVPLPGGCCRPTTQCTVCPTS